MRALRITLIVLLVLGGLAAAADRVAVYLAQDEVAKRAEDTLDLAEQPSVKIQGFPFLTQVTAGSLDHVDVSMRGYPAEVDEQTVTLETLDVELRDVSFSGSFSEVTAGRATGAGTMAYDEMSRAYGELIERGDNGVAVEFDYAGDGQLQLTLQATMLGQTLNVGDVTADMELDGDRIRLRVAEEDIPAPNDAIRDRIRDQLDVEREVSGLPDGFQLDGVTPTEDGLALELSGSDAKLG